MLVWPPRRRSTPTRPPGPRAGTRAGPDERRVRGTPERIGGYRLVRLLGRGGMGAVYEAEDVESGRRVALKLIAAESVASPEAVERFRQEGRLASTIAHPRCVFVLAADEEDGRPYIVMELMPGETLQSLVERAGPLPPREAIGKILDVIEGLREAHQLGVIHRDVKPSNCFLEADGRVKVGDFGLSKSLGGDSQLTRTGAFLGTPLYASPEQIKCDPIDARTDVYSVAATLYFLLTGRPPFQEADAAATLARIVSEPAPSLRGSGPRSRPRWTRWSCAGWSATATGAGATWPSFGPPCSRSGRASDSSESAPGTAGCARFAPGPRLDPMAPLGGRAPSGAAGPSDAEPADRCGDGATRGGAPRDRPVSGPRRRALGIGAQGLARSGFDARSTGVDPLATPRAHRPLRPCAAGSTAPADRDG